MTTMSDRPLVRVIRMRRVPFVDSTGMHNLQNLCTIARREGTHIVLSGVRENVYATLEHAGFCELLGKHNICPNINVALERAGELSRRLQEKSKMKS